MRLDFHILGFTVTLRLDYFFSSGHYLYVHLKYAHFFLEQSSITLKYQHTFFFQKEQYEGRALRPLRSISRTTEVNIVHVFIRFQTCS